MSTDRDAERRRKVIEVIDWPLADQINPVDTLDMPLLLAQMIARQRASRMHDPSCVYFRYVERQEVTDLALAPRDCDCWLSKCVLTRCGKHSVLATRPCSRCSTTQPVCANLHCMVCGSKT